MINGVIKQADDFRSLAAMPITAAGSINLLKSDGTLVDRSSSNFFNDLKLESSSGGCSGAVVGYTNVTTTAVTVCNHVGAGFLCWAILAGHGSGGTSSLEITIDDFAPVVIEVSSLNCVLGQLLSSSTADRNVFSLSSSENILSPPAEVLRRSSPVVRYKKRLLVRAWVSVAATVTANRLSAVGYVPTLGD